MTKKRSAGRSASLSFRLVLIFITVLFVSTIAVGTTSYFLNLRDAVNLHAEKALSLSHSIAAAVDTEAFAEVQETGQKNDFWYRFKEYVDKVYRSNNLLYLYVLQSRYDESVYYFAEGVAEGDVIMDLNETESAEDFSEEIFQTIDEGKGAATGIYRSGEFGYMVSGFAPIISKQGDVIGVVGIDIDMNTVVNSANWFGLIVLIIAVLISALMALLINLYLRRFLGRPIEEITVAARRLARGELDAEISKGYRGEIGVLADSFNEMRESTQEQADVLRSLAGGDLTISVFPRSTGDVMNIALQETIVRLNAMFAEINESAFRVTHGSEQITQTAQILARGASSQSSAVEELLSTMNEIARKTERNTVMAEKSASLAAMIKKSADNGFNRMEELIAAVNDIHRASNSVDKVAKTIEDLAFQTNLLSLNAAVEAARAGEHGTRFAVVAKEVQALANKSAESAKETEALIADVIKKTSAGVKLASEAHTVLVDIGAGISQSDRIANDIARSSEEQNTAIAQINQGITQVAGVVQQNNSSAEKSETISQELNEHARLLSDKMSRFKLK